MGNLVPRWELGKFFSRFGDDNDGDKEEEGGDGDDNDGDQGRRK